MAAERRWACIHDKKPFVKDAPEPCGKVAFYSRVPVQLGMLMRSSDFLNPDGSPVDRDSPIACGGCGKQLDGRFIAATLTVMEEQ